MLFNQCIYTKLDVLSGIGWLNSLLHIKWFQRIKWCGYNLEMSLYLDTTPESPRTCKESFK